MGDFKKEANFLLRLVGKGEMKAVPCLTSASNFCHFNVLYEKKNKRFLSKLHDESAEFSLLDILEHSSSIPEPTEVRRGNYSYKGNKSWNACLDIIPAFGSQLSLSGEKNQSNNSDREYIIKEITRNTWNDLSSRKLLKPEPKFLKEFRRNNVNLYVVSKTVEVIGPESHAENDTKLSSNFSIPSNPYVKVHGQINIVNKTRQSLTFPKRVVMNYKKKQLIITKEGWEIAVLEDKNRNTFQDEEDPYMKRQYLSLEIKTEEDPYLKPQYLSLDIKTEEERYLKRQNSLETMIEEDPYSDIQYLSSKEETGYRREIEPIQQIEEPISQDFKKLQKEILCEMKELSKFSKNVQVALIHNLFSMLGDRKALLDLLDMMDQFPQGHLDGPGEIILNELRKDYSENELHTPLYSIIYTLEAMMELTDTQLTLLTFSMEKRILLHQREVVRSILEPNFKYPWSIPFTFNPDLLSPLQGDGVDITYELLEESGLEIDRNSNRTIWDLEAKMPLTALYACLSLLQELAEA